MTKKQNNAPSKKKLKKALIITVSIICAVCVLLAGTYALLHFLGKHSLLSGGAQLDPDDIDNITYDETTITHNGNIYRYNENVTAALFIGCDRTKLQTSSDGTYGTNGQADTLMLLTIDVKTGKTVITAIPRDTMADIDIYSKNGSYLTTQKKQICLSYAYGDGKHSSCENTLKAVSKLFMGMPISSYLSIDTSTVADIQKRLGSITVTPNEDFSIKLSSKETLWFNSGVSTTISSSNVLAYLTHRGHKADSSYLRMERQLDYLKALSKKIVEKTKSDITYPLSLYTTFSKKAATNFTADKVTYLTSVIFNNRDNIEIDFKKIEGTQIIGEDGFAEFHHDKQLLLELILELFYTLEGPAPSAVLK